MSYAAVYDLLFILPSMPTLFLLEGSGKYGKGVEENAKIFIPIIRRRITVLGDIYV
jgi:hypothetical protein